MLLTHRANRSGSLVALYRGAVRVGYVEQRARGGYVWVLNVLRPQGNCYCGEAPTTEAAMELASSHFAEWMLAAELGVMNDGDTDGSAAEPEREPHSVAAGRVRGAAVGRGKIVRKKKRNDDELI